MIRIGFFGTPNLAARVLGDLLGAQEFEVVFVVTNPDKPIGRTSELRPSPVKEVALEHGIELLQPLRIRENQEFLERIRSFNCDYFVVVAYGKILPKAVLDTPNKKCINIHGSILPKYRGASPIQAALLYGEQETGVTIMQMSEGMDEGDILKIRKIPIDKTETSLTLFAKFEDVSGPALIQTLLELEHGGITPLPQEQSLATYCKKIEKNDGVVDWNTSAESIYHMWQAYTPWPGIYTIYEQKRLLLEGVSYDTKKVENSKIGQVVKFQDNTIGITCREGTLTLKQVKLEGKKSQNIKDFLNGNPRFISSVF
ncbi:MAG: methionyl-tRNA formyltransferase [Candidatus Altimarinota bacterium]